MEKKFIKIMESALSRYTRGGFLVGDYVTFVKGYKSDEKYKELNEIVKDAIEELIKSSLHIRVVGVDDYSPVRYPGNPDTANGIVSVKIAADHGGGRMFGNITVPPCILSVVDYYPNYAPFPDSLTRPNNEIIKPEEAEKVNGGIKGGDYSLPTKNTKLKGSKKKAESYTTNYLAGLKS